jgi:hypothetical protein
MKIQTNKESERGSSVPWGVDGDSRDTCYATDEGNKKRNREGQKKKPKREIRR